MTSLTAAIQYAYTRCNGAFSQMFTHLGCPVIFIYQYV